MNYKHIVLTGHDLKNALSMTGMTATLDPDTGRVKVENTGSTAQTLTITFPDSSTSVTSVTACIMSSDNSASSATRAFTLIYDNMAVATNTVATAYHQRGMWKVACEYVGTINNSVKVTLADIPAGRYYELTSVSIYMRR